MVGNGMANELCSPLELLGKLLLLLSRFSHVQLCATPEMATHQAPRPWDSPHKNTGAGCHFLLQCMKVKSESEVTQSCPTPRDPMDYSLHGIFQARVLEWGAIAFSTLGSYVAPIHGSSLTMSVLNKVTLGQQL